MTAGTEPAAKTLRERSQVRAFYGGRRVLVVGGDGFLGRNCVDVLVDVDARVDILTRTETSSGRNRGIEQTFVGDLADANLVRDAVAEADVIFDFAGSAGAVDSNRSPGADWEHECGVHVGLFVAASEAPKRPKVLFCSSRLVYGRPLYVPVDEKHPLAPQSFYAAHKIAAESYLKALAYARDLRFTVLRVSNPYGPHQSHTSSRRGGKSYGVINYFIQAAAVREPIHVYGDGSQIRDYIYAPDLVSAFVSCGASSRCDGEIFNVGGRRPVRIRDAAETITRLAGGPPVAYVPWPEDYKKVETGDYVTDISKLESVVDLGEHHALEEGLSLSLEAYRNRARAVTEIVSRGTERSIGARG